MAVRSRVDVIPCRRLLTAPTASSDAGFAVTIEYTDGSTGSTQFHLPIPAGSVSYDVMPRAGTHGSVGGFDWQGRATDVCFPPWEKPLLRAIPVAVVTAGVLVPGIQRRRRRQLIAELLAGGDAQQR